MLEFSLDGGLEFGLIVLIGDGDYAVWKLYFGETTAGLASGSVPEPSCGGLMLIALLVAACNRRSSSVNAERR